jgi:hypothetical protein
MAVEEIGPEEGDRDRIGRVERQREWREINDGSA